MAEDKTFNRVMKAVRQINMCWAASVTDVWDYMRMNWNVSMSDCELKPFIEVTLQRALCYGYLEEINCRYFVAGTCPPLCPQPCPPPPCVIPCCVSPKHNRDAYCPPVCPSDGPKNAKPCRPPPCCPPSVPCKEPCPSPGASPLPKCPKKAPKKCTQLGLASRPNKASRPSGDKKILALQKKLTDKMTDRKCAVAALRRKNAAATRRE